MKTITAKLLFKESDLNNLKHSCQKYGVQITGQEKQNGMFGSEFSVRLETSRPENLYLLGLDMYKIGNLTKK